MENQVNQRVVEFISYKKMSKLQFCELNNISYTTFSNNISLGRNLNLGIIIQILSQNSVLNSDWLLLGKVKMLQESVITTAPEFSIYIKTGERLHRCTLSPF